MNNEELTRTLYQMQQGMTTQGDIIHYMRDQIKENEKDIQMLKNQIRMMGGL